VSPPPPAANGTIRVSGCVKGLSACAGPAAAPVATAASSPVRNRIKVRVAFMVCLLFRKNDIEVLLAADAERRAGIVMDLCCDAAGYCCDPAAPGPRAPLSHSGGK